MSAACCRRCWRILPPQQNAPARRAVELLGAWHGEMRADAVQPLLFAAWLRELVRVLAADELGPAFAEYWDYRPLFVETCWLVISPGATMSTTPAVEKLRRRVADGAGRSVGRAERAARSRSRRLALGRSSTGCACRMSVWSRVPLLGDLLSVRLPVNGGNDTPLRAASRLADPDEPFAAVHGASFRAVYDLADPAASRFVVAGGQSGNPFSHHWADSGGYLDGRRWCATRRRP